MFRRLRAYRVPLAVLLAAALLLAMLSLQMISSNSHSLGYSVSVQVQGLEPGEETEVAVRRADTIRYAMTDNGTAVFEDLLPGSYSVYTDPYDTAGMATGTVHVPSQQSLVIQRASLCTVTVSVTGDEAARAHDVVLWVGGVQQLVNPTATLQNGYATLQVPPGTHEVRIRDNVGNLIIQPKTVPIAGGELVEFVVGNPTPLQNHLTVTVTQGGTSCPATVKLRDANSQVAYEAWVQDGVAQFPNLNQGRYLVEAVGDTGAMVGYAVVSVPASRNIAVSLTQLRTITIETTGNRAGRVVYFNCLVDGLQRFQPDHLAFHGNKDTVQLPDGTYTLYLYDSGQRSLASRTVRVAGRDATVSVRIDSSGSSGSGGSSGSSSSRWTSRRLPVTTPSSSRSIDAPAGSLSREKAESAARTALSEAKREGLETVTVRLKDIGTATRANLRRLAGDAGSRPVEVYADSMNGKRVEVRIMLDPELADRELNLSGSTTNSRTKSVQAKFEKWYTNRIRVVAIGQKDAWGQPVRIAAYVELDKFNTDNLYLYSYQSSTNSYKRIAEPHYRVDTKGYLHFTTELGGDIVISNGPLQK